MALELFHARGYHAVQMSELAAEARTSKPTLYARLGGKEEIYTHVLEREAALLKGALYAEYARAMREPVENVIATSMLAFFRFAGERRAGFDLLFRSEPGGPGRGIGERAMDEVIAHVRQVVDDYISRTGGRPGSGTPLLAAAGVGVARQVCQYALDMDYDLSAAGGLATVFAEAGMTLLSPAALREFDIRRTP